MIWLTPRATVALSANEVHVWRVALERGADEVGRLDVTLAPDEQERAASFIGNALGRRWTIARGALRVILGQYLGMSPKDVRFRYSVKGKPSIDGPTDIDFRFNLAHSENLALIAIARDREVGIDVEAVRSGRDLERIAERFFSPREAATLKAISPPERDHAFYRCWTRKEAYLKAMGGGLSVPLDSFDVAFAPGAPAELLAIRGAPDEPGRWSMLAFDPGAGYAGALVVEGSGWTASFFSDS